MSEKKIETSHLTWRVLRLTEKAITLLESGRVDDAIAVVDNRERALNLLATRADITVADVTILNEIDKLNEILLSKFIESKEQTQKDIASTHKNGTAHRSYQSNQVK
ncbi:MAG: hypothetical protein K2P81_04880 [Bacteriovoracaceae bacterium]|nr:hypothetical protein [Bacteriovoracaceae bacterium]